METLSFELTSALEDSIYGATAPLVNFLSGKNITPQIVTAFIEDARKRYNLTNAAVKMQYCVAFLSSFRPKSAAGDIKRWTIYCFSVVDALAAACGYQMDEREKPLLAYMLAFRSFRHDFEAGFPPAGILNEAYGTLAAPPATDLQTVAQYAVALHLLGYYKASERYGLAPAIACMKKVSDLRDRAEAIYNGMPYRHIIRKGDEENG